MENNDSNIKPTQTRGLKLMTVFVAVVAAHAVVIGGMTAYYMLKGSSSDVDLLADKGHKSVKVTADGTIVNDGQLPDTNTTDKTAPADMTSTVASTPAPTSDSNVPVDSAPTPAVPVPPTTTIVSTSTPAPATPAPFTTPATPVDKTPAPVTPEVASTPVTPDATPVAGTPYVVKAKDSLAKIARNNHTTVAKLKAANSLSSDMLHIGQKLVIPAKTQVAAATADTTPATTILGTTAPAVSAPVAAPETSTAGHQIYTVVKGDTLTKIAHKFKTTPKAIMVANSLTDATKLSIGKKLKIPSKDASATTSSAPAPSAPQPSEVQGKAASSAQLANFMP